MNSTKLVYLLIIINIFLSVSCNPTRKIIKEPLKEQGNEFLLQNLKENELHYDYLSSRFNATFKQDKHNTQITGQIRIKRDSAIWISVSPLMGIEMARFLITNDSIRYLNRMGNTYMLNSFDYINKLINSTLDFDMLQSFLTGNDFSRYENTSFRSGIDDAEYTLVTSNRRKLKRYVQDNVDINIPIQHIWLNPENFKITRIMIREIASSGRKAQARYTHMKIDGQEVPVSITFDVETDNKKTSIDINYTKIQLGDSLQFPFKIPEKYTRVNNL